MSFLLKTRPDALKRKLIRVISVTNNCVKLKKIIDERIILDKIDINTIVLDEQFGFNPLLYACAYGTREVVSVLLMYGKASVKEKTALGSNPVIVACQHALPVYTTRADTEGFEVKTNGQRNFVELLVFLLDDISLSANATDKKGNNALHVLLNETAAFVSTRNVPLLKEATLILLKYNCSIDAVNAKMQRPFDELALLIGGSDCPALLQELFHSRELIKAQAHTVTELPLKSTRGSSSFRRLSSVESPQVSPGRRSSGKRLSLSTDHASSSSPLQVAARRMSLFVGSSSIASDVISSGSRADRLRGIFGLISLKSTNNQQQIMDTLAKDIASGALLLADVPIALLLKATEVGKTDVVAYLADLAGEACLLQCLAGFSPLSIAIIYGQKSCVSLLLDRYPCSMYDSLPSLLHPTLCLACAFGASRRELQLLLDGGTALDSANQLSGWAPRMYAELNGQLDVLCIDWTKGRLHEVEEVEMVEREAHQEAPKEAPKEEHKYLLAIEEERAFAVEEERARLQTVMELERRAMAAERERMAAEVARLKALEEQRWAKYEKDRLEKALLDRDILERERVESDTLERERIETERLERELDKERLEKDRLLKEILEKERLATERLETERLERELDKERLEKDRLLKELLERERLEIERLERKKLERLGVRKVRVEKQKKKQEATFGVTLDGFIADAVTIMSPITEPLSSTYSYVVSDSEPSKISSLRVDIDQLLHSVADTVSAISAAGEESMSIVSSAIGSQESDMGEEIWTTVADQKKPVEKPVNSVWGYFF